MPRKTLALISGLVIVTIILFIIALRAGQQQAPIAQKTTMAKPAAPMVPAHTVLAVNPNPLILSPGQQGSVNITMNTSDNDVTAVQLELGYDPNIISNVKVTPGPLFTNPGLTYGKDNPTAGRYTYMLGIAPSGQPVKGTGVVATVTFTVNYSAIGKNTQIGLLPTSLVTARGVAQSVLKTATGAVLTISNSSSSSAPVVKDTAGMGAKTGTTSSTINSTALPK